jgi:two-component sensor histidine kinase
MIAMVAGSGTTAMALWRWTGGRSYLDAWVLVTLVAFTCEVTFSMTGQSRFSMGWYFGRIGGLICTGFLLVMFIVETTRLYARLGEAHQGLSTLNRLLERRIDERTRDLQMANQQLGQALAEKDLLLREVYHRVRNNLQVIDSLMSLYGTQACGKCRDAILEMRTRSQILGLVHQQLMRSPDLVTFNARDFLSDLCTNLAVLFEETHQGVRLEYFSDDFPLDLDHAIPLGLVINDLVSNAFKHAFPNNQTGTVQVSLVLRDVGTVCLSVQDNGVGMSLEAVSPTSVGHQIIEALLAQLDATMTISGKSGTVIEIILPLPAGASF